MGTQRFCDRVKKKDDFSTVPGLTPGCRGAVLKRHFTLRRRGHSGGSQPTQTPALRPLCRVQRHEEPHQKNEAREVARRIDADDRRRHRQEPEEKTQRLPGEGAAAESEDQPEQNHRTKRHLESFGAGVGSLRQKAALQQCLPAQRSQTAPGKRLVK